MRIFYEILNGSCKGFSLNLAGILYPNDHWILQTEDNALQEVEIKIECIEIYSKTKEIGHSKLGKRYHIIEVQRS